MSSKIEVNAIEIRPGLHWIGALDPKLREFDITLQTERGTTYNAYCVRGQNGVAIIDTVKASHADEFFARLEQVARYEEIKAIVLNHLEPDHSGALPELMHRAPQAMLYLSYRGQMILKGLLKRDPIKYTPVNTGDTIELGGRTLQFLHTPFLHWPDTQCTYLVEEEILFSGDVFGCHFCDARLFNDQVDDFNAAFDYYYMHLMRPFREHVLAALALIEQRSIHLIAPAHGPILRDSPARYIQRYRQFASFLLHKQSVKRHKMLLVFYVSAYGNTTLMAQAIHQGAETVEGVQTFLYNLQNSDLSTLVDLLEEADGLVLGSPTINGDAAKPIWDLLSSFTLIRVQGKLGAAFGSYGWSGEAVNIIEERLRSLKLRVPLNGLRIKFIPTHVELEQCYSLGRELALHLTHQIERRVPSMRELTLQESHHHA